MTTEEQIQMWFDFVDGEFAGRMGDMMRNTPNEGKDLPHEIYALILEWTGVGINLGTLFLVHKLIMRENDAH